MDRRTGIVRKEPTEIAQRNASTQEIECRIPSVRRSMMTDSQWWLVCYDVRDEKPAEMCKTHGKLWTPDSIFCVPVLAD